MTFVTKTAFENQYGNPSGDFQVNSNGEIEATALQAFANTISRMTPVIGISNETQLRAIITANLPVGIVAIYRDSASLKSRLYQLLPGALLTDSPNILRPNDFAVGSNEKYWSLALNSCSYSEATAPTVDNDSSAGYLVGDTWIDSSGSIPQVFTCVDNSVGAAVWLRMISEKNFEQEVNVTASDTSLAINPFADFVKVNLRTNWNSPSITGLIENKVVVLKLTQDYTGAGSTPNYPFQVVAPSNISLNDGVGLQLKASNDGVFDSVILLGLANNKAQQIGGVSFGTTNQS